MLGFSPCGTFLKSKTDFSRNLFSRGGLPRPVPNSHLDREFQVAERRQLIRSQRGKHLVGVPEKVAGRIAANSYFSKMLPYQSFVSINPPRTASVMLSKVPIRKYSAKRSFKSGKRAIDLPVRIRPIREGDWTKIAVRTRKRSSHPIYKPAFLTCSAVSPGLSMPAAKLRVRYRMKYPPTKTTAT